jgi:hypothetical protein
MCNLRGQLMLRTNRPEQAKLCFMEALALDVRCFDAFDALVAGEMLTPEEGLFASFALTSISPLTSRDGTEWQFVQGLAYASQAPDDATFVRLAYVSRLRKHAHGAEHEAARTALVREYGLADNADVLWAFADALYAQFRWADCFKLTERCVRLPCASALRLVPAAGGVADGHEQDIGAHGGAYTDHAAAHCVHVSPAPPPLAPVHSRARTRRGRARRADRVVRRRRVVPRPE